MAQNFNTVHDIIAQAVNRYPLRELSFITSSAHDSSIQTMTFSTFNQYARNMARAMFEWGKPTGSIIVVYLNEHEDNMVTIWACLMAGYIPCLQPALSAQQTHKEAHIAHIKNLFESAIWLTNELGAEQIGSIDGLEVHLFSDLKASAETFTVPANWIAYEPKPDDHAMLFLTSGSTGFSKAVVHTHRTILAACRAKVQRFSLPSESRVLNCETTTVGAFF
jgi:acyl-CoA synthetase (AMP-forming)/AMP-acid ligase II